MKSIFRRTISVIITLVLFFCLVMPITAQSNQDFSFREKKELTGYSSYIMETRFSPYRNYFAATIGDNSLEIYDNNWNKVFDYQGDPASVGGHISFSPDEKFLAYAKYKANNDIAIIDLESMKVVDVLIGHSDHIQDINWSHSGDLLASCSQDNTIRIWRFNGVDFKLLQVLEEHNKPVSGISFSYDDSFLASVGNDSRLIIYQWDGNKYRLYQDVIAGKGYLEDCEFHPLKNRILVGSGYGTWIYDQNRKSEFVKVDSLGKESIPYRHAV